MDKVKASCINTTKHISDKILLLRRINKLTQEQFAEKVGLDRRTIARAEDGKHRPSPETMEMIAIAFNVPVSYFFDESSFKTDLKKTVLLNEINTKLNILPKSSLRKVSKFIDLIND